SCALSSGEPAWRPAQKLEGRTSCRNEGRIKKSSCALTRAAHAGAVGAGRPETPAPWLKAPEPSGVLVVLDERVGRVVVNGLEILRFHQVGGHTRIAVQPGGHVAHHVLDELRVVVGAFGHVLLVGALENPVQLARGLALGDLDELLDPHVAAQLRGDGHVRAVVVQLARVAPRLHVLDLGDGGARELGGAERWSHERKPTGNARIIALLGTRRGRGLSLFRYAATGPRRACAAAVGGKRRRRHAPPAERRRSGACSAHQRSMLAPRPAASSPAARRQPSREPCSMKRSGMPSCSTGSCRASAASTSRTAEPAPPCVAFSSMVTSARWRAASDTTRSSSSGLTKRMLTSVASRASAIGCAALTSAPNASSASPLLP